MTTYTSQSGIATTSTADNFPTKRTQQQRILALLLQGFREHREIGLPEILNLRIGLYNTRIKELRAAGWQIVNRQDAIEGRRHSWYSLRSAFPSKVIQQPEPTREPIGTVESTKRPGWKSQGFTFGNPENYAGPERKQPQTANFSQSLLWETGVRK